MQHQPTTWTPEIRSSLLSTFVTEGKRYTEQRTNFTDSYLNSGKMKVENENTRLNLRELGETIGVSSGNKTSVDTIDRQTVSSKVEEPISCEVQVYHEKARYNGGEPVTPSHQRD